MPRHNPANGTSRRAILAATGALVVSVGAPISARVFAADPGATSPTRPPLLPTELSSYIAIDGQNRVSAFFGKIDLGQGLGVAIAQMIAEELDVPYEAVTVFMGDTATSVNQGGASGSQGIAAGGKQMRAAAAEARRVLLTMAAAKWNVPVESLSVSDGVITGNGKKITYGALLGGKYFSSQLEWNKQLGNALYAPGKAKLKTPAEFKVIGKPIKRNDVAAKVFCQQDFTADVRRPGMLHARMIRPEVAGATPVEIDDSTLKKIPGARVYRDQGLLAVLANTEWDAIRAADALRVMWSQVKPPFVEHDKIYDYIRNTPARSKKTERENGTVDDAIAKAARVIQAEYEWPFQSHSSMGPGAAVAEYKDGELTVWSGTQKPHYAREGISAGIKIPLEKVHAIWVQGPGSYGRNDAGDVTMDAAFLAKAIGGAVRVQYMRADGTGWDPKATASIHRVRAGLDASGKVIAYDFFSKGFNRVDFSPQEQSPKDTLAGQFTGLAITPNDSFGAPEDTYGFDNARKSWEIIPAMLERASPLRTSHLRDPLGPQIHFAQESFMDEVAAATKTDPVAFRLAYMRGERDKAVLRAAAEKAGWKERTGPRKSGNTMTGRGVAYAQRGGTIIAIVAEVEVDAKTGRVWPRKFTVAHDCGLIINPDNLTHVIECNLVHASSRALFEEVRFNHKNVTSVDWITYPIMGIEDTPEAVEVVLLNHSELASTGGGEGSSRPVAAAIANAIFDATGARVRRAPFTPERIKQALSQLST